MQKVTVKTFVAIGIGSALFFVLGKFLSIPVFANTNINLQYAVLALLAVIYGPLAGGLIGLIGHTLIDLTTYGPWWSWIIASAVFGLFVGFAGRKIDVESGTLDKKQIITFNAVQIIANVLSWCLIAPVLDILIYSEPVDKLFTQAAIAATANIVSTGVIGTILLLAYSKTIVKSGSLNKE